MPPNHHCRGRPHLIAQEGCCGRRGIFVLISTAPCSSPPSSVFGLFLHQIFHVTYKSFLFVGLSGPLISLQSLGLWELGCLLFPPFSTYLELSEYLCLAHGAIPVWPDPFTSQPCFPTWPLALPHIVPQAATPNLGMGLRARNWGIRDELLSLRSLLSILLSWPGSPGALLAQAGSRECALPTRVPSCVCTQPLRGMMRSLGVFVLESVGGIAIK